MRVAAVDIGTNSTRLLVADPAGGRLTPVLRTTTITRLGEGVDSRRYIDEKAMARTCAVLADYCEKLRSLGATRVGVIATSACRDAENREEFFERVREAVGTSPRLLGGHAEAMLSFAGAVSAWEDSGAGPFLVVDIGGGSTEVSFGILDPDAVSAGSGDGDSLDFPGMRLEGWTSLNIGCVRLTERFLRSDPPKAEELSEALREVDSHLVTAASLVPVHRAQTLIGLAGTVTSLAAMDLGLDSYDPDAVHHYHLAWGAVEKLFGYIATSTKEELRREPILEPMRADVIVGGAVVLVAMLRRWSFPEVVVSEADILDGVALATSLGLIGTDAA